jgi:spore germination cell wall hydrolase CwlJ-like protein
VTGVQVASIDPNPGFSPPAAKLPATPAAVQVASIDPAQSSALNAIDQVVPMAPTPMAAPRALAYARETTGPTLFDPNVDKYGNKVSTKDVWCMAQAIYFEARGETYRGQVAVGQVVMNRLAHPIYPKDICQVVFQNQQMHNACQFSFACDGIPETIDDPKSWKQADEIAKGVISGSLYLPEVGKATHYHATYVYQDWAPRLKRVAKIGHHIFYQFKSVA